MSTFGLSRLVDPTNDNNSCFAMLSLSQECMVCHETRPGPMWTLGPPYYCQVHKLCLPHFPLNGEYPHNHVINVMCKSSTHGANN